MSDTTTVVLTNAEIAAEWRAGTRVFVNAAQLAQALRLIADELDTVTVELELWATVGIQPGHHREVDILGAAFGVEATTEHMDSGAYQRQANAGPTSAYTSCPPPAEVRREVLLAQLAELDAEDLNVPISAGLSEAALAAALLEETSGPGSDGE